MNVKVLKNIKVVKEVSLPSSKSISNRLLILKALLKNELEINNLSEADDTLILNNILSKRFNCTIVDVKNAGTCFRFLTAYFSLTADEVILTGSKEMKTRPIKILVEALQKLGADINEIGEKGFPPLRIVGGKLKGDVLSVSGEVSSQYITALLLIAPFLDKKLKIIILDEFKSKSYVIMTIKLLNSIGVDAVLKGNKIVVYPLKKVIKKRITVEYDWSSASYWFEYVSFLPLGGSLLIKGLKKESIQGDKIVKDLYAHFGVKTEFLAAGTLLKKVSQTDRADFVFDFSSCPDLVQTLVLTCVGEGVDGIFKGVSHLKYKETNRVEALKKELSKFNYDLKMIEFDSFKITKKDSLPQKAIIKTYKDHRMAMSFAPLALKMNLIEIENPEVVKKSYPYFWGFLD